MLDLLKIMEEEIEECEGIVKSKLNPDFNFDLKKKLGRINPYTDEGIAQLTEDEKIKLQKWWCMATRAVPLPPKR
jgi:hypothetical protein